MKAVSFKEFSLTKIIPFFKIYSYRMLKAYKYRVYPNKDQKRLIKVHFGACRFVYNWAL
ncbi:Mobile element protein [Methanosarcina barkeri str. Wiesmoor]|uniref:Mobile element protein n=1 Tax=Methanosarcina barkeri str. Wiesmoor TaxID=1434109 RepID=A0A0E3LLP1_METBA|nr:Mobile element protein [Methanosarcina barkeri str. Wiesmoor]